MESKAARLEHISEVDLGVGEGPSEWLSRTLSAPTSIPPSEFVMPDSRRSYIEENRHQLYYVLPSLSADNIITSLEIVTVIATALRESVSSSAEYRTLLAQLHELERALLRAKLLDSNILEHSDGLALKQAALYCQGTFDEFLEKVKTYQPSLGAKSNDNKTLDLWRRLKWDSCKNDDLENFQDRLKEHTETISLFLMTTHMVNSGIERKNNSLSASETTHKYSMGTSGQLSSDAVTVASRDSGYFSRVSNKPAGPSFYLLEELGSGRDAEKAVPLAWDSKSVVSVQSQITDVSMSSVNPASLGGAAEEAVEMLANKDEIRSLITKGLQAMNQDRFERNFRRLLKEFAINLRTEATDSAQRSATRLIHTYRAFITRVISKRFVRDPSESQAEAFHKMQKQEVSKVMLERLLSNFGDATLTQKPDDNPDSVYDVSEFSDDGQPALPNLTRVKEFIISSNSFATFAKGLHDFVNPLPQNQFLSDFDHQRGSIYNNGLMTGDSISTTAVSQFDQHQTLRLPSLAGLQENMNHDGSVQDFTPTSILPSILPMKRKLDSEEGTNKRQNTGDTPTQEPRSGGSTSRFLSHPQSYEEYQHDDIGMFDALEGFSFQFERPRSRAAHFLEPEEEKVNKYNGVDQHHTGTQSYTKGGNIKAPRSRKRHLWEETERQHQIVEASSLSHSPSDHKKYRNEGADVSKSQDLDILHRSQFSTNANALSNLSAWLEEDTQPLLSSYPSLSDGNASEMSNSTFPIPTFLETMATSHVHELQPVTIVKRLTNRLNKLFQPSTNSGYRRVEWTCGCGKDLYADFKTSSIEAIEALEALATTLQGPSDSPNTNGCFNDTDLGGVGAPASKRLSISSSAQSSLSSPSLSPMRSISSASSVSSYPTSNVPTQSFLEVCINTGEYSKTLSEIDLRDIGCDGELFRRIRKDYLRLRGFRSRFWLLKPSGVDFVRFAVEDPNSVGILQKPFAIPPPCEVSSKNYAYSPCPLEDDPPMPQHTFLHYLSCTAYNPKLAWLPRLPKKLNSSILRFTGAVNYGWGIHINEGPNYFIIGVINLLMLLISGLAAFLWKYFMNDFQGAFGFAGWIVAVVNSVLVSYILKWQQA